MSGEPAESPPSARLVELAVSDLGIIDRLHLVLGPNMTALTGETGAGKTMVVGAIELLLGGRADPVVVRSGATEAVVEGRFEVNGEELILTRVVPAEGRSRAYVNGRMATATALGETSRVLIDLHGQNAHQSLLSPSVQRQALDRYADIDVAPLVDARNRLARLGAERDSLGGDPGTRARELDLLRHQIAELDAAELEDPGEDAGLSATEEILADAFAHQEAAQAAVEALRGDHGGIDRVREAGAALDGRLPFETAAERLASLVAELTDVADDVRHRGEEIDEDPEKLADVRQRRQLLVDLRRKYGTAPQVDGRVGGGTLADVITYRDEARARLAQLESHDADLEAIDRAIAGARAELAQIAATVGAARRAAAPALATEVEGRLADLAMAKAALRVTVDDADPGDEVRFLLAANPGLPAGPLNKVASGGELARTMLALRLVLGNAPPILVFDEVDAGIGGNAAVAVGRSLAALGRRHQVLVVTHLPQVAAYADHQVLVSKSDEAGISAMSADPLSADRRVDELSRMLAGSHGGVPMREAARELLDAAGLERER